MDEHQTEPGIKKTQPRTHETARQLTAERHAGAIVLLLLAVSGCSEEGADSESVSRTVGSTASQQTDESARLAETPRWPNAVGGEERLLDSGGKVVATVSFPIEASAEHHADLGMNSNEPSDFQYVPVQGIGGEAGNVLQYRYLLRVSSTAGVTNDLKLDAPSSASPDPEPNRLEEAIKTASDSDRLPVYVSIHAKPTSSLRRTHTARSATTFGSEPTTIDRTSRIHSRMSEVALIHQPIRERFRSRGIQDSNLTSLWLTGGFAGALTPQEIEIVQSDPAVRGVSLDEGTPGTVADHWDGTNLANGATDGLNVSLYRAGGYHGDGWNPVDARYMRLGFVGDGFYFNHAIFRDWENGPSRFKRNWDCRNSTCVEIFAPLGGDHETLVASAAGGDATQAQVPGVSTAADRLDHTGVASEVEMYSAEATAWGPAIAAIQRMIEEGVDVVNLSRGDWDVYCNYDQLVDDWSTAVKQAHDAGVLVVASAGNTGNPLNSCSITRWAQAPSAFVVSGTVDPNDNGYATSAREASYAIGPMNAGVYNGSNYVYRTALTGIDAVVPGSWLFGATTPNNFVATGGTSLASPQVSGAAMLVKHSFLSNGLTYIDSPGVLFTALLAMTDRESGSTHLSTGFNSAWGGGRMQLRYFMSGSDHPAGGAWGLDQWETVVHQGDVFDFPIRGTAAEPTTIQQFKVYAMVFEGDWAAVADVDIQVRDKNCGVDSAYLGGDSSYDTKSMVRVGSIAAGRALCVRVTGYAIPPEGRRVVLTSYFSVDTAMR